RRLVADELAAARQASGELGVGDVAPDVLDGGVEVARGAVVGSGQAGVEDHHVVAVLHQRVDDVGADEAGAAGDEGPHRGAPTVVGSTGNRTTKRAPPSALDTVMSPWWAWTRAWAMARPRPAPPVPGVRASSPRKPASKTRSRWSSGIPPPVSATVTSA